MSFLEHSRLFEEALGGHGEELGGIGGPVLVEHGGAPSRLSRLQSFVLGIEDAGPRQILAALLQKRSAVDRSVLAIQLVGEFVEDEVLAIVDVRRPGPHVIPRENDDPAGPRLAEPGGFALEHHAGRRSA